MSHFAKNPSDFSATCQCRDGECVVSRDNILFLDGGEELAAVDLLQRECGRVVVIPDLSSEEKSLLYHTSCQRMTDVVLQIFEGCLEEPTRLPQYNSELSLGELHRRAVSIPYGDCRARVDGFDF